MKLFIVDIKTNKGEYSIIDYFKDTGTALLVNSKKYWNEGLLSIRSRPLVKK